MASAELLPAETTALAERGQFKRFKMKHRRIVALHLRGKSQTAIAAAVGCSPSLVSTTLRRPQAKAILAEAYAQYDAEARALFPLALDAIRRNIQSGDGQTELKAADMALKINGKYEQAAESAVTAEDVIERVLERIDADGTTVRVTERRRSAVARPLRSDDEED